MSQDKPVAFKREDRYLVIKREDIAKYLRDDQQVRLRFYADEIAMRRIEDGKTNHGYVVVSDDWPEYETVFQMIEARVTGKPVAAQEPRPIFHYYKILSQFDGEEVWTFKPGDREVLEVMPLYDHAAPCARCAELEAMSRQSNQDHLNARKDYQAKITEQDEELRIVRANLAQLEQDFDRRNEVVDAQAERIKALEAEVETITNRWKHRFVFEDGMQAKLAKADAVILQVKSVLTSIAEYANAAATHNARYALAAIEAYQKGE